MIVEGQKFNIKITKNNIQHYLDKGYNVKLKDVVMVKAEDLPSGSHYKVYVMCDYCGEISYVAYKDYMKYGKKDKHSCKHCMGKKVSEVSYDSRQEYLYNGINDICNKNGYTLLTKKEDIKTAETRVKYKCKKHGINETKLYTLFIGHVCPKCGVEKNTLRARHKPDEIEKEFDNFGGVLVNKEEYENWGRKNLKVICPECKKIFVTSYGSYMRDGGQLCPNCTYKISKGELRIRNFLDSNNIQYNREYRFDDCKYKIPLPFDFYIESLNMCIEYDGEGHYRPIQRTYDDNYNAEEMFKLTCIRDEIKNKYCKNNDIDLLRIPYWDYDNIETILEQKLFT